MKRIFPLGSFLIFSSIDSCNDGDGDGIGVGVGIGLGIGVGVGVGVGVGLSEGVSEGLGVGVGDGSGRLQSPPRNVDIAIIATIIAKTAAISLSFIRHHTPYRVFLYIEFSILSFFLSILYESPNL
ncbi:MAG: hypothetical protein IMF19_07425 [Proteobacteria bacterium]|nr:hypothetical protein [Pseudomonadota bacterium]